MKSDIIYLERVDSTNAYAKKLLNGSSAGEGTVVWAGEQYAGRGLGENTWYSGAGLNLTFSLILEPLFLQPDNLFCLNKAVAVAVLHTIRHELPGGIQATIKWPNDIYAGNHKLGGILIEHTILGTAIKHTVIGVGINLNQEKFPAGIPNPVSLLQLTGKQYDPRNMLEQTISNLAREYSRLSSAECDEIVSEYDANLLGLGKNLVFTASASSFNGNIQGVDDLGRLCVMTEDGVLRKFSHGEVVMQ
ncbi:MAG: biotin--[acetyl-CoA-carboxylase] ligase [Bacteroidetes bacterium]|nr:biotin--[acetyl-CoA-carboxylase] ligase [Bacteroidota bacterium]